MQPPPPFLRAFTLVELLVVLAIIAILAGLIFSGARSFLDSSRNARSTSNLREIGRVYHIYIQENNGWLGTGSPPGENGRAANYALHLAKIAGVIESVNNPKPTNASAVGTIFESPWNGPNQRLDAAPGTFGGYAINGRFGHNVNPTKFKSRKLLSCPVPSRTIAFAEGPTNRPWHWVHEDRKAGHPLVRDGKALIGWLDGHVSREPIDKLYETVDGVPFYYWSASKNPDPSGKGFVGWDVVDWR
jgi:prepilin-type N-terminal cleavage/methylation domain-containing protein